MVGLVMVMTAVEEVAMIGTMIGTMKSTMMWGYFMDELYNLFVVKPCWASMVLQGWRRSMAAIGPLYFLDIKDQLLFLAVGICPLACGLTGQL